MTGLKVGDSFPDFTLPDHRGTPKRLSGYTAPSPVDERLGFTDMYPVVVIFGRGFFCPRDQRHMRNLVPFQDELRVNYCKLVSVSVDAPRVQAAFRAGLGAEWPFLSDEGREVIKGLGILDETEGEYADVSRPFAFVLRPDLTVHKIYDGWFFVGRPTTEELRMDLREITEARADYRYDAYDTEEAKKVRIPQREWLDGAPPLGANGLPVASGSVKTFDLASGNGEISREDGEPDVFFNFTAIPGEGYRTIRPGTPVRFEVVEGKAGPSARNVQRDGAGASRGRAGLAS